MSAGSNGVGSNSTVNQEACAWIAKMHDNSPLPPEQEAALRQWLRQSPAHKQELKRMAKRWEEMNVLTELAVPVGAQENKRSSQWVWPSGLAAAALLFVVVVLQPFGVGQEPQIYSTKIGEQRLVSLADNSTVLLNTNSVIQVRFTRDIRNIMLVQGEALFDVASNPERPFRVQAGKSVVQAIGTAFSVYLKQNTVDVMVTEGVVEIKKVQDTRKPSDVPKVVIEVPEKAVIKAGQAGTFHQNLDAIRLAENISKTDIERKLSWREGVVRFSGDPLADVVAEISRYTGLKIVVVSPELQNLRVGALFKLGQTHEIFEALELGFGIHAERINEKEIHLMAVKREK